MGSGDPSSDRHSSNGTRGSASGSGGAGNGGGGSNNSNGGGGSNNSNGGGGGYMDSRDDPGGAWGTRPGMAGGNNKSGALPDDNPVDGTINVGGLNVDLGIGPDAHQAVNDYESAAGWQSARDVFAQIASVAIGATTNGITGLLGGVAVPALSDMYGTRPQAADESYASYLGRRDAADAGMGTVESMGLNAAMGVAGVPGPVASAINLGISAKLKSDVAGGFGDPDQSRPNNGRQAQQRDMNNTIPTGPPAPPEAPEPAPPENPEPAEAAKNTISYAGNFRPGDYANGLLSILSKYYR